MDETIPQDLLNMLANEFKGRVRLKQWKLSSPFSDQELVGIAMSHLYEAWSVRWDRTRPFENFARTSAWQNFLKELKKILGRIPDSGLLLHPDSTDTAESMYPPVLPGPTQDEKRAADKAEKLINELEDAERKEAKEKVLLARRRCLLEFGLGNSEWEGVCDRLSSDLHPDIVSVFKESEVTWLAVLSRRHALINHGRPKISDAWIDNLTLVAAEIHHNNLIDDQENIK